MRTVNSKSEFINAIKASEKRILCKAEAAKMLKKFNRKQKIVKATRIVATIASLATIPFTGGTSMVANAAVMGLTANTVTISTAELVVLVGGSIAMVAVLKGRKLKCHYNADGSIEASVE